jgi:hypothetical protein
VTPSSGDYSPSRASFDQQKKINLSTVLAEKEPKLMKVNIYCAKKLLHNSPSWMKSSSRDAQTSVSKLTF